MRAQHAYNNLEWEDVIENMEKAVEEYHQEYKRCTILCEGSHDHESLPDFYNAVAGRWIMFKYYRTGARGGYH